MTEQFANFAQSSLATNIDNEQTTIHVANASTFPATGDFRIVVQSFDASGLVPISNPEIMLVTAVLGNGAFTVTRAAESAGGIQQAYAFRSGARVAHIATAAVMQALQSGGGVASLNTLTGAITLVAGTNVSITPSGNTLIIASSGGAGSGIMRSVNSISSNTNAAALAATDYVYLCSGTITLTLPTAVNNTNLYTVKNVGSGTVTVATTSAQTIDGASSLSLIEKYQAYTLISDNSNWNIVA